MTTSIYVSNKYNTLYHSIINNAISKKRYKGDTYYESHHIEPKSFGGSNSNKNLVLLTPREHYICHYLLTKFTLGDYKSKMIYGFHSLHMKNPHQTKRYINSKFYEINKLQKSKIMSYKQTGIDNPMCKGTYVTPFGNINLLKDFNSTLISSKTLSKWCRNSNKIISKISIRQSKYLQLLNESPLGKTFREIGFDYSLN